MKNLKKKKLSPNVVLMVLIKSIGYRENVYKV